MTSTSPTRAPQKNPSMPAVNVRDAKTQLSRPPTLVDARADVIIARRDQPVAKLVRYRAEAKRRFDAMIAGRSLAQYRLTVGGAATPHAARTSLPRRSPSDSRGQVSMRKPLLDCLECDHVAPADLEIGRQVVQPCLGAMGLDKRTSRKGLRQGEREA